MREGYTAVKYYVLRKYLNQDLVYFEPYGTSEFGNLYKKQ